MPKSPWDCPIFDEIVRHLGHRHFGCIAGWARLPGAAAVTGTRAFPRAIRMVLADPSADAGTSKITPEDWSSQFRPKQSIVNIVRAVL